MVVKWETFYNSCVLRESTPSFLLPSQAIFRQYTPIFRTCILSKIHFEFILKCNDTFCKDEDDKTFFSQKDNATFKIDIFWNMGVGVDHFKLYDILVGNPRKTRGNMTKCSLFKHYIICRIKIPKISKRVYILVLRTTLDHQSPVGLRCCESRLRDID